MRIRQHPRRLRRVGVYVSMPVPKRCGRRWRSRGSTLSVLAVSIFAGVNEYIIGVLVGLTVAGLCYLANRSRGWRPHPISTVQASLVRHSQARTRRNAWVALEAKVDGAQSQGTCVAISRQGYRPSKVTWSDGTTSWYFDGDLPAYKSALASGRYPIVRTFHGQAPEVGTIAKPS